MVYTKNFLIRLIFFGVPIVYAWLYIPWTTFILADIFPNLYGFEAVKVNFFLFLVLSCLIMQTFLAKKSEKIFFPFYLFIVFLIWTISSLLVNRYVNPFFLVGTPMMHHGWYLFLGLLALWWMLANSSEKEKKSYLYATFWGLGAVVLYALFHKFGADPSIDRFTTRIDLGRIFSTLGNPNYVAGYLLMLFPLFLEVKNRRVQKYEWIFWIAFGFFIYLTGSYLAYILFVFYFLVRITNYELQITNKKYLLIVGFLVLAGALFMLFSVYGDDLWASQKFRGLLARWYLWGSGLAALFHSVPHMLVGYGPDGFITVSEQFRHPMLSVLEDPAYRIESSHNVFIDIALQFGIPMLLLFLWHVGKIWNILSLGARMSLLLFALYFSFNIPVLAHFLIVVLILARPKITDQ